MSIFITMVAYYHGGERGTRFNHDRPAFFTHNRKAAESYAYERSDFPTLYVCELHHKDAAKYDDIQDVVISVLGKEVFDEYLEGEMPELSDGTYVQDVGDFTYDPSVRRELELRGFDSFTGLDIFSNSQISVVVVWNPGLIDVVEEIDLGELDLLEGHIWSDSSAHGQEDDLDLDKHQTYIEDWVKQKIKMYFRRMGLTSSRK